mgnify:CR=1 FL=1
MAWSDSNPYRNFPWREKTLELSKLFYDGFKLCKVKEGTTVAVNTDPRIDPSYADAAAIALHYLGADFYTVALPYTKTAEYSFEGATGPLMEAWRKTDMLVNFTMAFSRTVAGKELRGRPHAGKELMNWDREESGPRILFVMSTLDTLRALFPTKDVTNRGVKGVEMIEAAKTIRVTSASGTDLTWDKTGLPGYTQDGLVVKPGEWDNFGSGTAGTENRGVADGTLVIDAGDAYFATDHTKVAAAPVNLTIEDGRITKIEGGCDAKFLREWFASFNDERAYEIVHIVFGTHPGARWTSRAIMEYESYYGGVLIAFGGGDVPDRRRAHPKWGAQHGNGCHIDMAFRNCNFYLDGEPVIEKEKFVITELK